MNDERLAVLLSCYEEGLLDGTGKDELLAWIGEDQARRREILARLRTGRHLAAALSTAQGLPDLGRRCLALAAGDRSSRRVQVVGRVRGRLRPRRRQRRATLLVLVCAAALLIAVVGLAIGGLPASPQGASQVGTWQGVEGMAIGEGGSDEAQVGDRLDGSGTATLALADGSRLTFTGAIAARLAGPARVLLMQGRCEADVRPRPEASPLVIATPRLQVTVLGTRFVLTDDSLGSRILLDEGQVALADPAGRILETITGPAARGVGVDGRLQAGAMADASWRNTGWAPHLLAPGQVECLITAEAPTSSGWRGSGLFTSQAYALDGDSIVLVARVRVEGGGGRYGVVLCATPTLDTDAEGQPTTFQRLELFTDESGVLVQHGSHTRRTLHAAGSVVEAGRWYTLGLAVTRSRISAWINGRCVATVANALPAHPHLHLGIRAATKANTADLHVAWRDVAVWQVQ